MKGQGPDADGPAAGRGEALKPFAGSGCEGTGTECARRASAVLPMAGTESAAAAQKAPESGAPLPPSEEIIHSRSVQMGSDRLGVTAKMDLVEVRAGYAGGPGSADAAPGETGDLFAAFEVCPVDYKAGAPREGVEANELWDADKMQLGLQVLILRDNGYACREGGIYYRATKQRVRLEMTTQLESWILARIAEARVAAAGALPPPLAHSPKCPRCSLVTVCLPDETRLLREDGEPASPVARAASPPPAVLPGETTAAPDSAPAVAPEAAPGENAPRRLIAARDDRRALYLNKPGLRVGRSDEVLQIKEERTLVDEVRINDVSHLALFGNIQLSTQAIQALCEAEVPVTYFSMGGWFYGLTRGHELKYVFLRIEQFRLARDAATCLRLARQFIHGKIRNHRTLLMRNHLEPPPATLLKLKHAAEAALHARSLDELLGIEGGAAAAYFEQFSGMIKIADDLAETPPGVPLPGPAQKTFNFNFNHRNRRPPTDPVNALLSLAYDVANDKRLRRVFKTCKNYGDHLQFSVFECDLNPAEKVELERALNDTINHDEDQVLFVALGPAEGRGDRVITALGLPYSKLDAPCYVF